MQGGFTCNLRDARPNASHIGFTTTPIEKADANTRAVFGDHPPDLQEETVKTVLAQAELLCAGGIAK